MQKKMSTAARYMVLVLAVALIGIGAARKEPRIVLKKAVNICLECIGIG